MKTEREKFLEQIEAFLDRHDMPASRLGQLCLKDATFVFDIRKGQNPKLATVDKVRRFMSEYKPDKVRRAEKNVAA